MFMKTVNHHKTRKWVKVAKISLLVLIVLFVILSLVYGDQLLAEVFWVGDDFDPSGGSGSVDNNSFFNTMKSFYGALSGLIGILAVVMIIAGGIVYATSEGNSDKIKTAKEMVMAAIMGVLLFAFANWLLGGNAISKYFPVVPMSDLPGYGEEQSSTSNYDADSPYIGETHTTDPFEEGGFIFEGFEEYNPESRPQPSGGG